MATVACPSCRSFYSVDERLAPTTPFRCRACGAASTLGAMLQRPSGRAPAASPSASGSSGEFVLPGPPIDTAPRPSASSSSGEFVLPGPPAGFAPPRPAPPPQVTTKTSSRLVVAGPLELAPAAGEPTGAPAPPSKKTSARQVVVAPLDLAPEPAPEPPPVDDAFDDDDEVIDEDDAVVRRSPAEALHRVSRLLAGPASPAVGGLALLVIVVTAYFLTRDDRPQRPRPLRPAPRQAPDDRPTPPDPAPVASKAPRVDPQAIFDEAKALAEREQFAAALARLRDLPDDVRRRQARLVSETEARLKEWEAFRAEAQALLDQVATWRANDDLAAAWRALDAFLEARKRKVPDMTVGRRVLEEWEGVQAACAERGVDPTLPVREEPPERAEVHARAAAAGEERVAALRARLAEERAHEAQAWSAELERAREASSKAPITLELVPGFKLEHAVVEGLDDRHFTLRSASGDDVSWPWDAVRPEVALRIRRLGVRDDVAGDHLRLGTWCLRRRAFREAKRAFKQAVAIDEGVKTRVPDVDALERAAAAFKGDLERRGGSVSLSYDFKAEAEAQDFAPAWGRAQAIVRDGRLEVHGQGLALVQLEMGFNGLADVTATLGPTTSEQGAGVIGLSFASGTEREETWLVIGFRNSGHLLLARWRAAGGDIEVVEQKPGALRGATPKMRVVVRRDRIEVVARGRTQASRPITPLWEKCRVLVGANVSGQGGASLEDLTIRGRVRTDWLRKTFGEFDALLGAVLARLDELPTLARPDGPPAASPLSAEDAWSLEGLDEAAVRDYREAAGRAAAAEEGDLRALLQAIEGLNGVIERARGFAAAYYQRARISAAVGLPGVALLDLRRARALCPRFHEALALEAVVLHQLGKTREAAAAAEEAIALRPDHADGWAARGLLRFFGQDLQAALDDLELALALAPHDEGARGLVRNVRHVLAGPPWTRRFTAETEHFVLETDISQRRADEYARDLEAVRKVYAARFGLPAGGERVPRAKVLIFDAEEGYHSYADLTLDDRVESTLGCYLPRYRQLLLFEDRDDAGQVETRQTLFHEGFHQFLHQLVPDNLVPFWLNEGLAEYLSACTVEHGEVVAQGAVLGGRLQDLRYFLRAGGPIPLDRLMKESPAEFYSGPVWAKYAQAWSMVHFFEEGGEGDLRDRFHRYIARLREGASADDAFAAAWTGVSWPAVQRAWRAHVDALR